MDPGDVKIISDRLSTSKEEIPKHYQDAIADCVQSFIASGEPQSFHIPYKAEINPFAQLFDLGSLNGRKILSLFLENKVSCNGNKYSSNENVFTVGYDITVAGFLNQIADGDGSADYPNDFVAGFAVELDESTCIVFALDQEELVGICGDCSDNGYDDAFHGCGHAEDTYQADFWFAVCGVDQLDRIEWDTGDIIG